jgi:hypothetical protein
MYVHQLYEDQEEEEDPDAVDNLLSKELLQLSLKDRTAIQEEIHGVKCLAPEETQKLLNVSLLELAVILENDDIIPPHKKEAYRKSQQLPKTYVNDDDFRLRFLRFTLFDVRKAAYQIVRFLHVALELFGEFALERAVRLSDFDSKDLKYLREGEYQFLPFRDRRGRRIFTVMNPLMPREDLVSAKTRHRKTVFVWYYFKNDFRGYVTNPDSLIFIFLSLLVVLPGNIYIAGKNNALYDVDSWR